MPIEIRELHIRVAVNASGDGGREAGAASNISKSAALDHEGQTGLVADCVEQVLEILNNKAER